MKIFNWVHRKFHNPHAHFSSSAVYSRQTDELKIRNNNVETNNNDAALFGFHAETQTLLKEVTLVDMPQCWKEGILTIGTLGSSVQPLCSLDQDNFSQLTKDEVEEGRNYNFEIEEEEEEGNNILGEDESNPLVRISNEDKAEMEKNKFLLKDAVRRSLDENKQELIRVCEVIEAAENKKGLRTTLADLFSAESPTGSKEAKPPKPDQVIKKSSSGKKPLPNLPIKFVKKIIPNRDDNSRPLKNINKLMRRMLKRKIHPDLGGKIPAEDGDVSLNNQELSANEGVSLLQPQGAEMKA